MSDVRRVKIEEVLFSGHDVIAAPEWAFHRAPNQWSWDPVPGAWNDILVEINRRIEIAKQRDQKLDALRAKSGYMFGRPKPVEYRARVPYVAPYDQAVECVVCNRRFFAITKSRVCSDTCWDARHRSQLAESRRRRKREVLPRRCAVCAVQFIPTRSDAKFCSVRCRVAHHRQQT